MAHVNIKLHYHGRKPKYPMHKVFWGLHIQEKEGIGYWFCDHDRQWHTHEEVCTMMEQGIKFNFSNYDHGVNCIRKLKRFLRKNLELKGLTFFMSHNYMGYSATVTARIK
ncbi:hypothetical protein ABMH57_000100 [Shigella flexneri]